jgi:hypothetical protein
MNLLRSVSPEAPFAAAVIMLLFGTTIAGMVSA